MILALVDDEAMVLSEELVEIELVRELDVDVLVVVMPNNAELIEDRSPPADEVMVVLLTDEDVLELDSDVRDEGDVVITDVVTDGVTEEVEEPLVMVKLVVDRPADEVLHVGRAENVLDALLLIDALEVDVLDVELDSRLLVVLVAMLVEGVFVVTVLEDVTDQGAVDDVLVEVLLWVLLDGALVEVGDERLLGVLVTGIVVDVVLIDEPLVDDAPVELLVVHDAEELDSTASRYPRL